MKIRIVLLVFALLSVSCEPKLTPKKPDNLISKDKMTDLLYDMFVLSSAKGVSRTKFEKMGLNPEEYILKKYSIDSLQFAQSNNYYSYDIEQYKSMIESVKAKLSAEKKKYTEIDKQEEEEKKRKKDSIRDARQRLKPNPSLSKELKKQ